MKAQLPGGLEPDLLDGTAWIGLVLLSERGVSATPAAGRRFLPLIDHFGANIRTYVLRNGVPGIYFFSLECSDIFAAIGARLAGIPYFTSKMSRTVDIEAPVLKCADYSEGPEELAESPPAEAGAAPKQSSTPNFIFEFASERGMIRSGPKVSARWRL